MNEENLHKGLYAIIPSNVRYDPNLKDKAKLLYAEISALSNEKGYCWASNDYFSKLLNTSPRNVTRLLSELKKANYLDIKFEYKKDKKEIEKRIITLPTILSMGIDIFGTNPLDKNVQENNIIVSNNIIEYFNSKNSFSKIKVLTKTRKDKLLLRIKEQGYNNIIKAIDMSSQSDFLTGKNDRGWKMDFDWLISNDTNIVKILEGKYSNKKAKEEKGRAYGPILN